MQKPLSIFHALQERLGEIYGLHAVASLLEWDQEVCMPRKGAAARARHLATVSAISHEMFISRDTGDLITAAQQIEASLSEDQRVLLREATYEYERAMKIPVALMRELAETRSRAYHAWLEARRQSCFSLFQPFLKRLIDLARQKAECLGYMAEPYDALLEEYERGMTAERLRAIFAVLVQRQRALLERILGKRVPLGTDWAARTWNVNRQRKFTELVLQDMGYDFEAGRQDVSAHPFTTNFSIHDVRITNRFSRTDPLSALYGAIHEGGHALYEQGFKMEDEGTLLAQSPSLGMHESQSRLWENMVGRSLPFFRHYLPRMCRLFPKNLEGVLPEQFYAAANRVSPSLIRVEADECTYNLHVILRFELEVGLMDSSLALQDIPDAWNQKMRDYLGVAPPNDAAGCLQDIHWSRGAFGYFPTYALGNLYAAQLFEALSTELPNLEQHVESGDFLPLRTWLRKKVHAFGRRMTSPELIRSATGSLPDAESYLRYLEKKYGGLYDL